MRSCYRAALNRSAAWRRRRSAARTVDLLLECTDRIAIRRPPGRSGGPFHLFHPVRDGVISPPRIRFSGVVNHLTSILLLLGPSRFVVVQKTVSRAESAAQERRSAPAPRAPVPGQAKTVQVRRRNRKPAGLGPMSFVTETPASREMVQATSIQPPR